MVIQFPSKVSNKYWGPAATHSAILHGVLGIVHAAGASGLNFDAVTRELTEDAVDFEDFWKASGRFEELLSSSGLLECDYRCKIKINFLTDRKEYINLYWASSREYRWQGYEILDFELLSKLPSPPCRLVGSPEPFSVNYTLFFKGRSEKPKDWREELSYSFDLQRGAFLNFLIYFQTLVKISSIEFGGVCYILSTTDPSFRRARKAMATYISKRVPCEF